jgi:hypothetical protein
LVLRYQSEKKKYKRCKESIYPGSLSETGSVSLGKTELMGRRRKRYRAISQVEILADEKDRDMAAL